MAATSKWAATAGTRARRCSKPLPGTSEREKYDSSPFGRTFGVELEIPTTRTREELIRELRARGHNMENENTPQYTHRVTPGWKVVWDRSINGNGSGWELVSPVLCHIEGLAEVVRMCDNLEELGCEIDAKNTSCGFHVHVGAKDLDSKAVSKLIRFHQHAEKECGLLYCVAKSRRSNDYCQDTDLDVMEAANAGGITFDEVRAMMTEKFQRLGKDVKDVRYVALNMFDRCATYGTVEFRRHGGTLNGEKCVAWILHCLCMVSASRELGDEAWYGNNLRDCLTTIGMFNNGKLCEWAAEYLLIRHRTFTIPTRRKARALESGELDLPEFPGSKDEFKAIKSDQQEGVGLDSYETQYEPYELPDRARGLVRA